MILYFIRHGDPDYAAGCLTPLGERQAEAVARRLAVRGMDAVYSSPINRAKLTAKPLCELLHMERRDAEFSSEDYAWRRFTYEQDGKRTWLFQNREICELFCSKEIRELGDEWYTHSRFSDYDYKGGLDALFEESNAFFNELGYDHLRNTGKYRVLQSNRQRIALFAHQGFGIAFLSCLLDIPYPMFATHFDIWHSGVTVIEFKEQNGFAIPIVLTHSSEAHLYKEGLPLKYNNSVWI